MLDSRGKYPTLSPNLAAFFKTLGRSKDIYCGTHEILIWTDSAICKLKHVKRPQGKAKFWNYLYYALDKIGLLGICINQKS